MAAFRNLPRPSILTVIFSAILLLSTGCGPKPSGPAARCLLTDRGPLPRDTTGSVNLADSSYLDNGVRKNALFLEASDSARLRLVSASLTVPAGKPVAFRFSFKFRRAMGELFEARLKLYDSGGALKADSSLYRVKSDVEADDPGSTQDWLCCTRCLLVPEGVSAVRVEVSSAPARGKVWLGETALVSGEDWMSYASAFSAHLKAQPEDKYVFTAARFVEPQAVPDPAPRERESGFLFFERKNLIGAWPYALPDSAQRVEFLKAQSPRPATASFAFGIKALEALSQVTVSLSADFSGPAGALGSKPVLYAARYIPARLGSSWGLEFGINAQMLAANEPQAVPAGQAAFYWLDVPVPENAAPGLYRGELSLQAQGRPAFKVPLELEVQPVSLPADPGYVVGMYYYPPDDFTLVEAHLKDMAAHGVYAISLSGAFVEKDGRGGVQLNRERLGKLDTLMGLMKKYGFSRPTALHVEDLLRGLDLPDAADLWTDAQKELYRKAIRLMNETAEKRGWCRLLFFPIDEPANRSEKMKLARLVLGILRKMPGIIPYCDLNSPPSVLELSDFIDVVCMQILSVSPQTVKTMQEKRITAFFYLPAFGWNAAFHRGIDGWFLPRSGAQGIYYFAYQSVTLDPYDELDGTHRDWSTAYPAPAPAYTWPCPAWQGIRTGIEDLKLKALAEKLIAGCLASPEAGVQDLGKAARASLDSIYAKVADNGPWASYQLYQDLPPETFEQWRQQIIGQVIAMQQTLK